MGVATACREMATVDATTDMIAADVIDVDLSDFNKKLTLRILSMVLILWLLSNWVDMIWIVKFYPVLLMLMAVGILNKYGVEREASRQMKRWSLEYLGCFVIDCALSFIGLRRFGIVMYIGLIIRYRSFVIQQLWTFGQMEASDENMEIILILTTPMIIGAVLLMA